MAKKTSPDPAAIRKAEELGLLFSENKKTLLECTDKEIAAVEIPAGITEIGANAFKNLSLNNSKFSINYDCRSQMQQSFKRRVALFVPDEKFAKPVEP